MSTGFGFMIEGLVAVLLLLTIGYCALLNTRLKRLKADEQALKGTIAELITATEIAERAIAGLKLTVRDCDQTLGERLRSAERLSVDLAQKLSAGSEVVARLSQIAAAARPSHGGEPQLTGPATPPDMTAIVAAAQAFAARTKARASGFAA